MTLLVYVRGALIAAAIVYYCVAIALIAPEAGRSLREWWTLRTGRAPAGRRTE